MIAIPFAGNLVLLDREHQQLHLLNPAAAAIWTLLDSGFAQAEAAVVLAQHSGQSIDACANDIAALQDQWAADGTFGPAPPKLADQPRRRLQPEGPHFYCVHGVDISFGSEDEEVQLRVTQALSECLGNGDKPELDIRVLIDDQGELQLIANDEPWLQSTRVGEIVGAVFHLALQRAFGADGWLAMMHAGAMAKDGTAIVLPGWSGSGKSTLAAHLARGGFDYLSDDLAAIDRDGCVVAWPTPLSIKRGAWGPLAKDYPELEALPEQEIADRRVKLIPMGASKWAIPHARVSALVFPQWIRSGRAELRALRPEQALERLLADRIWLGFPMTEPSVRRFLDWLAAIPTFNMQYSNLDEADAQVGQVLSEVQSASRLSTSHLA